MKYLALIISIIFLSFSLAIAGDKQLTFEWQQNEEDLPELAEWELFMSLDATLPFDQWVSQGKITYDGNPASWYDATFTITVPDGAETATYFKMTAIDNEAYQANHLKCKRERLPLLILSHRQQWQTWRPPMTIRQKRLA